VHKILYAIGLALPVASVAAQSSNADMRTRFSAAVSADNVLPEYPRPQLVRPRWMNLNGTWQYAIVTDSATKDEIPAQYDGPILVPFAVESPLSGVRRGLTPRQSLWYHRSFRSPALRAGERLLLHFGAVDWRATVIVNGHIMGTHEGGYVPFSLDITDALRTATDTQSLTVQVWDPTDSGGQPRGKQTLHPEGIYYTAVSGIWQTVWLEPVPAAWIKSLEIVPDVDAGTLKLVVHTVGTTSRDSVTVTARAGAEAVGRAAGVAGDTIAVRIPNAHLWSPDHPFLYDLTVRLRSGDVVTSYAGMRKIAVCRDSGGMNRLCLNNAPLFELGMLDQGWWPEGLYTPAADSAIIYDLAETKALGFNMLRKHIKVEPDRWYYYADKLGVLVWQDMPSSDNTRQRDRATFAREGRWMIDALRAHPSIVMWVVFNEGWGQHDTQWYAREVKAYDPSRLVNVATGENSEGASDIVDTHEYGDTLHMAPTEKGRAVVIGEFGGVATDVAGHLWRTHDTGGELRASDVTKLWDKYRDLLAQVASLKARGLSAAVYTQVSDVEAETNGLMTYDRAVVKLPAEVQAVNRSVIGN
jgi:beta-galactosidase/beta-glucuronidase